MSPKKIFVILLLFLLVGAGVGYFTFSMFPDWLFPGSSTEHTLVATQENETFVTRSLFSFFVALAFAAVPLSALITFRFSANDRYPVMIFSSTVIMIVSMLAGIFYYQGHFSEMFAALGQEGISIRLDTVPYYKIPLLSAGATIIVGLLVLGFRASKTNN